MIVIVIDSSSHVPPYEQLRSQVAKQIQDRTLVVGTRLPTVRRLAADLGLARSEERRLGKERPSKCTTG
jgi:DNA-binding transcriptional regulator YhcF (GntR family)